MTRSVLISVLLLSACAFDEHGFPHFYRAESSSSPREPSGPDQLTLLAREQLNCPTLTFEKRMVPYEDSPATSRPVVVAVGCEALSAVEKCETSAHQRGVRFRSLQPDGGTTACTPE